MISFFHTTRDSYPSTSSLPSYLTSVTSAASANHAPKSTLIVGDSGDLADATADAAAVHAWDFLFTLAFCDTSRPYVMSFKKKQ